jgi:CubicO group peptidase (beta-lactamase class C family)
MHFHLCALLISIYSRSALADLLGPSYPAPVDLSSEQSLVVAGWRNVTATLQAYLNGDNESSDWKALAEITNVTFSLGVFSLMDPAATEMQFHYTSPEIANAPNGTHKVDGDSIYRIASVTKVFTVLAGLLKLKTSDWDRPLTDIVPTLAKYAQNTPGEDDPVYTVEWDKVTLSALAAQIAGIPRDPFPVGEIIAPSEQMALGLPPRNESDPLAFPPCAFPSSYNSSAIICNEIPSIESVQNRPPALLPWTSPGYSDAGFMLLGIALAHITGKSLNQVYRESIFDPLGMTSSNSSTPPECEWYRSVIPGDPALNFAFDAGVLVSTGGLLSTTNDLAKFGIGILNSTLLPDDQTRKWMKPVSHTASFQYSVGRPWEIMRYTHPSGAVTDMYTKSGDSGDYSSFLVLLPDYNAGFSILSSSTITDRFAVVAEIADLVTDSILPALAAQAAAEAEKKFAGVYTSTVQGLNSSLVLSLNQTQGAAPGLAVSSWISNGTDVLAQLPSLLGPPPYRLQPSISEARTGKVAFRLLTSFDAPGSETPRGLFSSLSFLAADWIGLDSATYGGISLSLLVFEVGSDGNAVEVSPAAFRINLKRTV